MNEILMAKRQERIVWVGGGYMLPKDIKKQKKKKEVEKKTKLLRHTCFFSEDTTRMNDFRAGTTIAFFDVYMT